MCARPSLDLLSLELKPGLGTAPIGLGSFHPRKSQLQDTPPQ